MSTFQEVFDMFSSARLPRMSGFFRKGGRTQRYSGGDGLAMPDADDEDVGPMGSDSPLRESRSVLGSLWWGLSSVALVAAMMGAELPWWLLMVAGLEMCACAHRMCTACAPHVHHVCTACTCVLARPAAASPLPRRCAASGPPLPRHSPAAPARAASPASAKCLTRVCTVGRYASVRRVVVLWVGGVDENADAAPSGHVSTTTRVRRPTSGQLATSGECPCHPTRAQPPASQPPQPGQLHAQPPPPLSSTHPRRLHAAPSASLQGAVRQAPPLRSSSPPPPPPPSPCPTTPRSAAPLGLLPTDARGAGRRNRRTAPRARRPRVRAHHPLRQQLQP